MTNIYKKKKKTWNYFVSQDDNASSTNFLDAVLLKQKSQLWRFMNKKSVILHRGKKKKKKNNGETKFLAKIF